MKIAVLAEKNGSKIIDNRVAITPEIIKKLTKDGVEIAIESGAGIKSHISDNEYIGAGATISKSYPQLFKDSNIILKINRPNEEHLEQIPDGAIIIGMLQPYEQFGEINKYKAKNITAFAMELIPRITRAQSMDILTSQANIAGYKAVIDAVATFNKAVPMMMTAAGTIAPAKFLIIGTGVAGLQAIATAKRLGGIVTATDVRPDTKEQVESLGAKFISVDDDFAIKNQNTKSGYAKTVSNEYKKKQDELIKNAITKQDIVITTALIPGKKAPTIISKPMVESMKPGAVIIDMTAEKGGNCTLTKPDKTIIHSDIKILGPTNLAGEIAIDASRLYANNIYNFVRLLTPKTSNEIDIDWNDEIISAIAIINKGKVVGKITNSTVTTKNN